MDEAQERTAGTMYFIPRQDPSHYDSDEYVLEYPGRIVGVVNTPEDAASIVKCCNGYEKAIAALEKAKEGLKAAVRSIHDPNLYGPVVDALNEARAVLTDLQEDSSTTSKADSALSQNGEG